MSFLSKALNASASSSQVCFDKFQVNCDGPYLDCERYDSL